MPPPHLHPRSRMTSSLFATTLFASFFVVALPHVLPCPAPRVAFADGHMTSPDGKRRRRRKARPSPSDDGTAACVDADAAAVDETHQDEARLRAIEAQKRECPVPKPRGALGHWLGFKDAVGQEEDEKKPKR